MKFILLLFSALAVAQAIPNPQLTPGAVRTDNRQEICATRTLGLRHVSASLKHRVYAEYGLRCGARCGQLYEVDHLISLEIGGSNDLRNLWPQPYKPIGARQKDVLENKLHKMICDRTITVERAQQEIAGNWYAAYKKYVRPPDARLGR